MCCLNLIGELMLKQFKKQENKEEILDGILIEQLNEHLTNNMITNIHFVTLNHTLKYVSISLSKSSVYHI